ncbi:MAG: response regulator [Spirochaetales bacterium]|nr:response regulator [Spirochaetales bacterium]
MSTYQETAQGRSEIARRVLVIQKDRARQQALRRAFGPTGVPGWEFIFVDRLEDAPVPVHDDPPYLHCIDASYREDEIKAYIARRRAEDTAHTVLALCGDSDRPKARSLFRHGIYDCVTEPYEPEELVRVLERSHERARLARETALRSAEVARKSEEAASLEHAMASVIFSTKRIAKHLSLEEFCRALMTELSILFGASGGSFYLVEGSRLVRVYALDPGHAPDEIVLPLAEGSFLDVARKTGRPVLASDIQNERQAAPSGFSGYKDDSCLVLPVFHNGDDLVAFISLHDRKAAAFSQREKTIGAALASVSAGFLRALRTLAETRERESHYEHFFREGLTVNFIALPDGRLSLANPAFYNLFCAGKPPVSGLSVVPFFARKREWETLVRRLKKEKTIDNLETELVDAAGGRRQLFGNLVANTNDKGGLVSVSAVFFDVTQKKILERELNHSVKMEAIGRLAGGVAHDFNNLITAILGYCEVVKDRVTDKEMAEEIEGIRRAGEKASSLTRQLLSLTRKKSQTPAPLNLARLVREIERLLARVIGEDIDLVSSFSAAEPVIRAERGEIEQVIMNLVVNARDAMPGGGRIGISISEEDAGRAGRAQAGPTGRWIVLRVSDEGVGMSEETQRHLFEPFYSTKEKGKGTGLGLSLVYGIVRRAGGYVAVESSPRNGSTFSLYFPKAVGTKPAADPPRTVSRPCSGDERILVVDDEKVVRQIVSRVLKKFGYAVCEAADGAQAIALARKARRPIKCAVIDLVMPGMSGPELAAELAKIVPGLKVLFVSGYAPEDIGGNAGFGGPGGLPARSVNGRNGHGGAEFVTKPFRADELARKVREILDREE